MKKQNVKPPSLFGKSNPTGTVLEPPGGAVPIDLDNPSEVYEMLKDIGFNPLPKHDFELLKATGEERFALLLAQAQNQWKKLKIIPSEFEKHALRKAHFESELIQLKKWNENADIVKHIELRKYESYVNQELKKITKIIPSSKEKKTTAAQFAQHHIFRQISREEPEYPEQGNGREIKMKEHAAKHNLSFKQFQKMYNLFLIRGHRVKSNNIKNLRVVISMLSDSPAAQKIALVELKIADPLST